MSISIPQTRLFPLIYIWEIDMKGWKWWLIRTPIKGQHSHRARPENRYTWILFCAFWGSPQVWVSSTAGKLSQTTCPWLLGGHPEQRAEFPEPRNDPASKIEDSKTTVIFPRGCAFFCYPEKHLNTFIGPFHESSSSHQAGFFFFLELLSF